MNNIPYKWVLKDTEKNVNIQELAEKFNFPVPLIKILVNRGYDTEDKIRKFINSDIIYLQNPFLFNDMVSAVEIVKKHIEEKNKILIWGDKDVDGITSVCLMTKTLKKLGADVTWYIPQVEGYGLNKETIEKYKDTVKLIVTVDCGITAYEEVKYIKENNIDVIITDHHEPTKEIVEKIRSLNVPIINPHLEDYTGFRDLAGVGVALKFIMAILMSYDKNYYNKNFVILDIETTGLSPITDEICEIAALKVVNFIPKDTFSTLVKPNFPIPQEVINIHKITNEMVKDAPSIQEVLPRLLDFIKDATLVVHNADFDISFINYQLKKLGLEPIPFSKVIDTFKLSKEFLVLSSHSLHSLSSYLLFTNKPSHRALDDVLATAELFYYLYLITNSKLRLFVEEWTIFAFLGTISDIVPLIEENRIIVKKGIEKFFSSHLPMTKIVVDYIKNTLKKPQIDAETISWNLIPLINSAGRLRQVDVAIDFLLTEDIQEANFYFQKLLELNNQRKSLQNTNLSIFYNLIDKQCNLKEDIILFVVAEGIERGVTGIIANNILKEFNRPVILLIAEDGKATGTARSPKGVNIYRILKKTEHLFEKFGGHENACGFTIKKENIPILKNQLKILQEELVIEPPLLEIDLELNPENFNLEFYRYLSILEPCGFENPYPIFMIRNSKIVDWKYFGKDNKHSLVTFEANKKIIQAVCWDIPDIATILRNFTYFNIVGEMELDNQDKNKLRFVLLDLQPVI